MGFVQGGWCLHIFQWLEEDEEKEQRVVYRSYVGSMTLNQFKLCLQTIDGHINFNMLVKQG